ncbi:MAG: DUF2851 family protein [Bacteroidetes bacterium]|nr:DUF2851 family protein [Bacteroidota bacterium]
MTEEFLHHVWKFRLFDQTDLKTIQGESVSIEKVGTHNFDSGPDFFNAKIKIADTLWAGNVEIHTYASDWLKHDHQSDKAYQNVVLHVVFQSDKEIKRFSGEVIPVLELKNRIPVSLLNKYKYFKTSKSSIPCSAQIKEVPAFVVHSTIDKLLLERLERKSISILNSLALNNNNWEETFYQQIARNFGFKVNAEPFELLAKSLPSLVLAKHKNSLLQIEALLFGQAGMLETHMDDKYALSLQNEYSFLKKKFSLKPIDEHLWKYMRLRPVNFPTVRIAQFAQLVYHSSHLFSKIIEAESVVQLKEYFQISASTYWEEHYQFGTPSVKRKKQLGQDSINTILINTVIPFLFVYGKQKKDDKYIERALYFLEHLDGDKNSIIDSWSELGLPVKNAYATQALLQLKNEYCFFKKCLNCNVGNYLMKKS